MQLTVCWHKLPSGHIKLNIDGVADPLTHIGGLGVVFRDTHGQWLCGYTKHLPHTDALQTELLALFHGLKIAFLRNFHPLIVESDSQVLLNLLQTENSKYLHLLISCRSMLRNQNIQQLYHIFREGNGVADAMAKQWLLHPFKMF